MDLQLVWFCLIAFFWAAYFVLEGFDFGVGGLLPFVGRNERERGTMLETIGPVWDGNEVWLVIAGGSTIDKCFSQPRCTSNDRTIFPRTICLPESGLLQRGTKSQAAARHAGS